MNIGITTFHIYEQYYINVKMFDTLIFVKSIIIHSQYFVIESEKEIITKHLLNTSDQRLMIEI